MTEASENSKVLRSSSPQVVGGDPSEGSDKDLDSAGWIPAFAGMTKKMRNDGKRTRKNGKIAGGRERERGMMEKELGMTRREPGIAEKTGH
jgi:hypothetical protein